jgi:gliding motility-associated-like protein
MIKFYLQLLFVFTYSIVYSQSSSGPKVIFAKGIGGTEYEDLGYMSPTKDGGAIITCYSMSTDGDVTVNKGKKDAWIAKVDKAGNIQWQYSYGGSQDDLLSYIIQTSDGGYIACGETESKDADLSPHDRPQTAWIIKLDASGKKEWSHIYMGGPYANYQTAGHQRFSSLIETNDGFLALGTVGFMGSDVWLVKTDKQGKVIWKKAFLGDSQEHAYQIIAANNKPGEYILSTIKKPPGTPFVANIGVIYRINGNGDILNSKTVPNAYTGQAPSSGGYVFSGNTHQSDDNGFYVSPDAVLMKLDEDLNQVWFKKIEGNKADILRSVMTTPEGDHVAVGSTTSTNLQMQKYGLDDAWVFRFSPNGDIQWHAAVGSSGSEYGYYAAPNGDGDLFVMGMTQQTPYTSLAGGVISTNHGPKFDCLLALIHDFRLITQQPVNDSVCASGTSVFTVKAEKAKSFQWQKQSNGTWTDLQNSNTVKGVTTDTLSVTAPKHQDKFRCIAFDGLLYDTSMIAAAFVTENAVLTSQPADISAIPGDTCRFKVALQGNAEKYQWQYNAGTGWTDISNSNKPELSIANVKLSHQGEYRCIITSACGELISGVAVLKIKQTGISSVLSPNGDGVNDVWNPNLYEDYELMIFDRNGTQVFSGGYGRMHWDGMKGNVPMPAGVYFYRIVTRSHKKMSGYILLVR